MNKIYCSPRHRPSVMACIQPLEHVAPVPVTVWVGRNSVTLAAWKAVPSERTRHIIKHTIQWDPILPVVTIWYIWIDRSKLQGVESTGTNLTNDEEGREWCVVIFHVKSHGFATELLIVTSIIIVDEYKLLNLFLVNTQLKQREIKLTSGKKQIKKRYSLNADKWFGHRSSPLHGSSWASSLVCEGTPTTTSEIRPLCLTWVKKVG